MVNAETCEVGALIQHSTLLIQHSTFAFDLLPKHPPHPPRTHHRPTPFKQDEPVLPPRDRGQAATESSDQIQDLIAFRLRFEQPEVLGGECGQNQHRSDNRYDLKDHDETTLSLCFRSTLRRGDA